jgi:hypothetical protein
MSLYNDASLLLIPSGYKSGKVYCQKPTNGDGDLDFTRASDATRVNSAGLIETVTTGVPRLDYSQGSCPALLLEPQRTNSMLYSNAINSWATKTELTITDNYATSPDGTTNASYIQQTTGGNVVNLLSQNVSVTTGQVQTVSFYAKAKEVTSVTLRLGSTLPWIGSARPLFTIDLSNGTFTSTGTNVASVATQNVGNGWYRYIVVTTATIAPTANTNIQVPTGYVLSPTSGDGFYLWGVQWEQNASYSTTLIPTTTATVTRIADAFSKTGISSLIGQTEGTLFLDTKYIAAGSSSFLWFKVFGVSNVIALAIHSSNSVRAIINGLSDIIFTSPKTDLGVKIAFAYNATGVVLFINGTEYSLPNGGLQTMTSLDSIVFDAAANTQFQQGEVNSFILFKNRLSNIELAQLTTL